MYENAHGSYGCNPHISGLSNALPAAASTLPEPEYVQSMQRLMDLGVFSLTEPDKMDGTGCDPGAVGDGYHSVEWS